ncbi:galactose oxidase [Gigaspora margarita]|uniref:Galactose oxidase n=1 Tax=Gigaspora margarita TaxID=4874 RepID=A0A8H4EN69_GIGMA|nr:galactose oxidase [Gigaspora margarita]
MMEKLSYILLLILQLFTVFAYSYSPNPRSGHLSAFINNKLYFISGSTTLDRAVISNDFFYIDCSMNFNSSINSIPYTSLSNLNGIPSIDVAGSSIVGPYNDIILTFGGIGLNNSYGYQLIYTFDTKSLTWNSLSTYGILPPIRKGVRPVFSYGRLYAFGGFNNINGTPYNSLDMLDIGFNWSNITLSNAPSGRDGYVSALLSNGNILYLGGYISGQTAGLDIVYLYDTNNNLWQNMSTAGTTPESRGYFTSVLNLKKNRLIIYGGESTQGYNHPASPTLAVLDLSSNPFTWISQNVSGDFIPPPLLLHTANVVHNYMILAYGFNYQTSLLSNDIFLLDISNDSEYKWVKEFKLNQNQNINQTQSQNSSLTIFPTHKSMDTNTNTNPSVSLGVFIGSIIAAVVSTAILVYGLIAFYKWYKVNGFSNKFVATPGTK